MPARSAPATSSTIPPSAIISVRLPSASLRHVVRHHQAGDVMLRHDALREREHLFRRARVERRRVLVEQQQLRRHHRRHQKRQRLPLTAREQTDGLAQPVPPAPCRAARAGRGRNSRSFAVMRLNGLPCAARRYARARFSSMLMCGAVPRRSLKQPPDDTAAVVLA